MKKVHWILAALGAAVLAAPGVAAAGDYDNEPEGDGADVMIETDEEVTIESDEETGIEGNGSLMEGEEDDTTVEGNGALIEGDEDEADVTIEGDGAAIEGEGTAYDYDYEAARAREESQQRNNRGADVQAQGGIVGWPGAAAESLSPGALYGVTVGIEPTPLFELELGYMGAAYQTDERLTGAQENAIENGGQALLVASPDVGAFEPYVFGGYQLSRFNVYERDNSTGAVQDETINKAPVGAGVDLHLGDVLVGARGSYNFVFNRDFVDITDEETADQITGSVLVGGQF